MAKTIFKILNKGDMVINITDKMIAVKRKNGEVDIIPFFENDIPIRIDTENIVTVSFATHGANAVETIIGGDNGELKIITS